MNAKKKKGSTLLIVAIICYVAAVAMIMQGYDKITNYSNPESKYLTSVNAYVGGDAYNYIINGNYATGYFVLASGFATSGTLLLATQLLLNANCGNTEHTAEVTAEPVRWNTGESTKYSNGDDEDGTDNKAEHQ